MSRGTPRSEQKTINHATVEFNGSRFLMFAFDGDNWPTIIMTRISISQSGRDLRKTLGWKSEGGGEIYQH